MWENIVTIHSVFFKNNNEAKPTKTILEEKEENNS